MKAIKAKLATNEALNHYIAYCFTFVGYGCVITGLGPLFPYLSAITGYPQTQYSYLLFCRAMGFIFGAITLRFFEKFFNFHAILVGSSIILLGLLSLFCFVFQMTMQGYLIFIIGASCCCLQVIVNMCVLQTQKKDIQFWMLICHGMFGVGGLIGPILVFIFEIYSFTVMGVLIAILAPFYYYLKSPQDHAKVVQQVQKEGIIEQMKHTGHQGSFPIEVRQSQVKQNNQIPLKIIGRNIELLVRFMFFIQIGLEVSFGSWIASYAVLENICTKEQATKYASIFWISMTVVRFLTPCLTLKSLPKLLCFGYTSIVVGILSMFLVMMNFKAIACYFGAIGFGICFSATFPLLLMVPTDYNMTINAQQNSNFMIWVALGQGILAMAVGYIMAWLNNDWLFYSIFIMEAALLTSIIYLKKFYQEQFQENKKGSSRQLKQILILKN